MNGECGSAKVRECERTKGTGTVWRSPSHFRAGVVVRQGWVRTFALGWGMVVVGFAGAGGADAQVAARGIARGAVLTEADICDEGGGGAGRVGPGWVARRVIAAGEPLREPAVGRPQLVRAGEAVDVVWSGGGVTLRVRGTAMGGAVEGERVLVRLDAHRRIEGTAAGAGVVRINGDTR
jgi:flagellar basal body P-ring formation protein FlgA